MGEPWLVPQVPPETAVQPDPPEQEVREVRGVVVRVSRGDRGTADRDVGLRLVRHRDRRATRLVRRRRRDRRDPLLVRIEAGERGGGRLFDELPIDLPRGGEGEAFRADKGFVELREIAPAGPTPAGRPP